MTETSYGDNKKLSPLKAVQLKLQARFHALSPFGKSLAEGLLGGFVILILLVLWMAIRADNTYLNIQPLLPYEVTEIIRGNAAATETEHAKLEQAIEEADTPAKPQVEPLPPAPIKGLSETKDGKTLPIVRFEDDLTPFQGYKRPFTVIPGRHLVAIVVVDYGLSSTLSDLALDKLPADITLALTPYAEDADQWAAKARAQGHEFWLTLPMQTVNTNDDSGPLTLSPKAGLQQNQDRLLAAMASVAGYAGLVTQKDHTFNSSDIDVAPMMKQIFGRGLALADSNANGAKFGEVNAAQASSPYVSNNFWLGDDLRPEVLDRTLRAAELYSSKNGQAVIFVQPYPVVLAKMEEWIAGGEARGLQFAPLSALAK